LEEKYKSSNIYLLPLYLKNNIFKYKLDYHNSLFNYSEGIFNLFPFPLVKTTMLGFFKNIKTNYKYSADIIYFINEDIKKLNYLKNNLSEDIKNSFYIKEKFDFGLYLIISFLLSLYIIIISFLGKLGSQMRELQAGSGGAGGLIELFSQGLPPYYLQLILGLYIIQIIIIMSYAKNIIFNNNSLILKDIIYDNLSCFIKRYSIPVIIGIIVAVCFLIFIYSKLLQI
jgi:hypothetical protein